MSLPNLKIDAWCLRRPVKAPTLRLICFSYAGGNASIYLPWQETIGHGIEICALQLPGRGARQFEAPITAMAVLAEHVSAVIDGMDELPFAFFGHSLGALVAYEVAHLRAVRGQSMPCHLIASGCIAPRRRGPPDNLHLLPDDQLLEELRAYNGTPQEVLENRELMNLLLPTLRADFELASRFHRGDRPLLDVPISAFGGRQDEHAPPEGVCAWLAESALGGQARWFMGDHFFIHSAPALLLNEIGYVLRMQIAVPSPIE